MKKFLIIVLLLVSLIGFSKTLDNQELVSDIIPDPWSPKSSLQTDDK
jgi:hypothetical protein